MPVVDLCISVQSAVRDGSTWLMAAATADWSACCTGIT